METFSTETQELLFAIAEGAEFLSLCKPLCNSVTAGLHVICFKNQVEKKITKQKNKVSSLTYFKSEDRSVLLTNSCILIFTGLVIASPGVSCTIGRLCLHVFYN